MATELAKAYVQIIPTTEGIKGKITEALGGEAESAGKSAGKSAGSLFSSAFGAVAKTGAAAIATVATGVTALTGAVVKGAGSTAEYGDNIDKMSQKMGLSAQAYQEWDAIMQHSGTSISSLQSGMKTLANAVENGNGAFERLGITQDMIAGMDNEQLFSATITALQNVDNETERTYLAGQLLGRGATELGALLNTSAEDTEAMRQRVHELGGVMSDEAVKAAAGYQDSLQDMQTTFQGLSRDMLSEFLPSLTTVMDGLTEIFSGNSEGGIAMVSEGISAMVDNISATIPRVMEIGTEIMVSLIGAISENLPRLLGAGADAVLQIADGLMQNLPSILEAGLQVVVYLAQSIGSSLPELIPTIVDIVIQIVDTLTAPDTLVTLAEASIAIIVALAEGLIKAVPRLLEAVPQIIRNLTTAFSDGLDKSGILDAFKKWWDSIAKFFKEKIPAFFENLLQLFVDGWKSIVDSVNRFFAPLVNAAKKVWDSLIDTFGPLIEAFRYLFETVFKAIQTLVSRAMKSVSDEIQRIWNEIASFITPILNSIKTAISRAWDAIETAITEVLDTIKDGVSDAFDDLVSLVREPLNRLRNSIESAFDVIKDSIADVVDSARQWGLDLIDNFVGGIRSKIGAVTQAVSSVADKIRDLIGFSEPEEGPLSNFHTFAPDMMELFAKGIRDNEKLVRDQVAKSFAFDVGTIDYTVGGVHSAVASPTVTGSTGIFGGGTPISIYVNEMNVRDDRDIERIAEELYRMTERETRARGGGAL